MCLGFFKRKQRKSSAAIIGSTELPKTGETQSTSYDDQVMCFKCQSEGLLAGTDWCFDCMRNRVRQWRWSSGDERVDRFLREQVDAVIERPWNFMEWVSS